MARVIGIGGLFWRSADSAAAQSWYEKHLGIKQDAGGAMFPWRDMQTGADHLTIWSIFPRDTIYFGDSNKQFMMNFIVDDLDGMLQQLSAAGVTIDPKREDHDYGRFAWIIDPDGNRVELWEPPSPKNTAQT